MKTRSYTNIHGFTVVQSMGSEDTPFYPPRITVDFRTARVPLKAASEDEILTGWMHVWEGETIASLIVYWQGTTAYHELDPETGELTLIN
jgi:hypothetical protein